MAKSSTSFGPGNNANPGGRPKKSAAIRKAERALRKGSPRAAERLMELVESSDAYVAIAACKIVLAKCLPDMKQTDVSGELDVRASGLDADSRRAAIRALETLASREGGSTTTTH